MKYYSEKYIGEEAKQDALNYNDVINVRFCRDCPEFDVDGIQPYPNLTRGHCRRLSFEGEQYQSYYVRVTSEDFCNATPPPQPINN